MVNLLRVGPYLLQCLEQGSAQAAAQSTLLQCLTSTWWAAAWLFRRHTAPVCTPQGLSMHWMERTQGILPKATRKSPLSSDYVPALGEGSHTGTHRLEGETVPERDRTCMLVPGPCSSHQNCCLRTEAKPPGECQGFQKRNLGFWQRVGRVWSGRPG